MKRFITALFTLITVLYPIFIYFAFTYFSLQWIAIGILLLFIIRSILFWLNIRHPQQVVLEKTTLKKNFSLKMIAAYSAIIGISLALLSLLHKNQTTLLFYPVLMNILLFSLFTFSLRQKMSIIEHFARLQMPDLPDTAVRYTRNVTKVWSLFFFLNGSIALYTVYSDDLILWTLYNGLISYVLMGILFTGEYLFRRYKQSRFSD